MAPVLCRMREGGAVKRFETVVAALFVDRNGPYFSMPSVDAWDESRDARGYAGPFPVVAHPPCGPWSSLRHLRVASDDRELAPLAVEFVRRFGGVLEHPHTSILWPTLGLPRAGGDERDAFGGRTLLVDQCDFGHPVRKRTRLYIVSREVPPRPPPREPTHWCSGTHTPGQRGTVPRGIKVCSATQRRRTPLAFAEFLVAIARGAA